MKEIMKLRESIYRQDRQGAIEATIKSIEILSGNIDKLDDESRGLFMNMIHKINEYFLVGDFLAISDVLMFDLLPLFTEVEYDEPL